MSAMKYATLLANISRKIRVSDIMHFKNIRALLENKLRICWWHRDYDVSKPVLVFLLGIIPVKPLEAKLDEWSSLFNVLVFEPVTDHYDRLFKGEEIDDIILFYSFLGKRMVLQEADIFGFAGFSLGGELAIRMAKEYRNSKNKYCRLVIAGDTYLLSDKALEETRNKIIINLNPNEQVLAKLRERIISSLNRNFDDCEYDGSVVYLNASKSDSAMSDSEANTVNTMKLDAVKKYLKNVEIIDFPNHDHNQLYTDNTLNQFYRKLFEEKLKI